MQFLPNFRSYRCTLKRPAFGKRHPHHAHAHANIYNSHRRRYMRFCFFGTSLPPKRGAGWGGGAQQLQQKSAAATAAAARARRNEINAAMRSNALLTCRLAVF
jgi:hypothetical protein